jgi:hypothetical protein
MMKKLKPLMTSRRVTRALTLSQTKKLIASAKINGHHANIDAIVEFKTDTQGDRLASKFRSLANNPDVNLKVTFKKINNDKN